MLYLFLVGIPMQIVAALITFADEVLYPWYVAAPRTWGLSPLDDQQLGGLMMWIPGNLWIFAAIGVLFFQVGEGGSEELGAGSVGARWPVVELRARQLASARAQSQPARKATPPSGVTAPHQRVPVSART